MNKIIINRGSFKLDEVVFEQGTTTIGRASSNTISLDDTAVSSHHAKIVTLFHTSYIEDLNSTNGTLVNGKTIHKHSLHSGDVIAVGNHQLLFQSDYNAYKDAENSETVMLKGSEGQSRQNDQNPDCVFPAGKRIHYFLKMKYWLIRIRVTESSELSTTFKSVSKKPANLKTSI